MESIPFYINSKKREDGSVDDSDFYYNFNHKSNENADNVLNIDSLSIPRSYYSINEYNNIFQVDTTPLLGITTGGISNIVLPVGDYNPTTLINQITSNSTMSSLSVSMTYSTLDKKFDFLGMTGINLITNDKQKYLGFNSAGTWSSTGGILESANVVDLSGTNSISVITDMNIETYNNSNKNSNMLLSIYPNTDTNGFIHYTSDSFRSIKLKSDRLNLQRFQLIDENLDKLNLNGLSWNMNLSLTDRNQ